MDGPGAETTSLGPFIFLSWICLHLSVVHFLSHGGWLPTAMCVCWGGVHGGRYRQSKLQWVEESSSLLNLHFKSQEGTSTTDCCCRSTQSRGCGRFPAGSRPRPPLWSGVMDTIQLGLGHAHLCGQEWWTLSSWV